MRKRDVSNPEREAATRQQLLGEEWWTSVFLNLMRPGHDTTQLVKGRRLAERGQVIVKGVSAGGVEAIVLEAIGGSRKVSLWVNNLDEDWNLVFRIFSLHQTLFSRLIAGDYPQELDDILKEAGIFIIPTTVLDLDYRCTCESHHTCSHIVATYMALGRFINEDPLTLFLLRGKSREEIIAGVGSISEPPDCSGEIDEISFIEDEDFSSEPVDPARYYESGPELDLVRIRSNHIAGKESDLIRMLGSSPFRLGRSDLAGIIAETYPKAARYVQTMKNFHK